MKSPPEMEKEAKKIKTMKPCGMKKTKANKIKADKTSEELLVDQLSKLFSPPSKRESKKETGPSRALRKVIQHFEIYLTKHKIMTGNKSISGCSSTLSHGGKINIWPRVKVWCKHHLDRWMSYSTLVRQFRHEGIDYSKVNEFTNFTLYMDFGYNDLLEFTEHTFAGMFKDRFRSHIHSFANGINKEPIITDFSFPFRRISMVEELEKVAAINIPKDFSSEETNMYLIDICTKHDIKCPPPLTTARLLNKLVAHFLVKTCVNPTFIIDYPEIMNPLAKCQRRKPDMTESFKLFINSHEFCNGYVALNDPVLYRERSSEQLKDCQCGDDELMMLGETPDMVLQHGLPPTGVWSISISRILMLCMAWRNIKERDSYRRGDSSSKGSQGYMECDKD